MTPLAPRPDLSQLSHDQKDALIHALLDRVDALVAEVAALRAEVDAALRERDAARDAASRATAATRGMAGDASESLQALDVRLESLGLAASAGCTTFRATSLWSDSCRAR